MTMSMSVIAQFQAASLRHQRAASLGMSLAFLVLFATLVAWIFGTGYRLKP